MSDSVTTLAIKAVSAKCAATFKSQGFRRRSPHLYREASDVFHCIHFQASQWGSRESGRFTVNLGITSASIYRHWTGRPLPANPATALWPIQQRIGAVCGEPRDLWWDVSSDSDVPALAADICQRIQNSGLPFFSRYPSTDAILDEVQRGITLFGMSTSQMALLHAMLLVDIGRLDDAAACIQEALLSNKVELFRGTILLIARRLKLPTLGAGEP
ncbi:MAG TPA: DUF4304 domain-containing protein [Chthoniobacter sp.]|jgi:hypothetical protein